MGARSSSERESGYQFINEEPCDREAPCPEKALPYQCLLRELRILIIKQERTTAWAGGTRSAFSLTSHTRHQIWTLQRELRFQQMVFTFLKNFIFSSHGVLFEALNDIQTIAEKEAERIEEATKNLHAQQSVYFEKWDFVVSKFFEKIEQKIKPDLKKFCPGMLDRLLQGNSCREYDISHFIYVILLKLKDLEISKPNMIAPVKKQMETLEEMLQFVPKIARKGTNLHENLQNFLVYFQPWVNIAAALGILQWVDEKDEELFAPLLKKFNLSVPELAEAYIVFMKALKPRNVSEMILMRETVGHITDIVIENFIVSTDDHFEMLREGLSLWMALLVDPPQAYAEEEKSILIKINLLVDKAESLIRSLCQDRLREDISKGRNILLNDFLEKINKAKAEVRQLHVEIPGLSWNNVPQTNRRGFFDFVLGNLQRKLEYEGHLFPFEKHLITAVHKELVFLRPFLMDMFELQDKLEELRDIWVQTSNVAYLVDYITDSCLSSIDVPIWSNLMHLSNAIEQIQFVKTKVSKIRKNDQMCNDTVIRAKVNSKHVIPGREQANAATKDDVKVGFAYEEQRIIDRLTAGEVGLDIIAIAGMPGQGKTTLAQRVFQDSGVELHFNKRGWCCISQAYDAKEILLEILKSISEPVPSEQVPSVSQEDLADRLRKRLKGQRYLIVLDDMWAVKAWYELQLSFPDDNNGSRILLTSRNHRVALEIKTNCCIVELYPLSFEESWNLLRMKVFGEDYCPPTLFRIAQTIAENCKGLPLAIVVVAGLLKKDKNVDSWEQISGSLKSLIASEGCMNILDLSFKHLPDYLKPCFLYLGAFPEDQIIDAKRLIQFWIAEGFVQNDGMKSKEVVASEYLIDLVSRSLVLVVERSSRYRIKKCRVHDLLLEFCLIKAEEERFLLVQNVSDHSSSIWNEYYRLCVHPNWVPFADSKHVFPGVRSLLVSDRSFKRPCAPSSFKSFKLLRVLDLGYALVLQPDFGEMTKFIHLRFLSVFCEYPIPSSISNLFTLEVFRLRYLVLPGILPSAVMKMANLRHMFASESTIQYTEDFDEAELKLSPPLTNLETFTLLVFDEESAFRRIARKLPNILKLGLRLSFCVHLSSYFKKLESLRLSILLPPRMTKLTSPSTLDFPSTLKKLNLTSQRPLSGTLMSSIGKLGHLEVLKLRAHFKDDRWDVEDDEFLQLKYLELRYLFIQEWSVSDESFPCLEQLIINNCFELGKVPGRFGAIFTLKRFEVRNCPDIVPNSFQQIVDEQMDSGNEGLQFSIS